MYAGQPAEVSYFFTYEILPVVAATAAVCLIIKCVVDLVLFCVLYAIYAG